MIEFGLRERPLADSAERLFVSEAGRFFRASPDFGRRYADSQLGAADRAFLRESGCAAEAPHDLFHLAHRYELTERRAVPSALDYLILVPTLRCNLSCSYCQVSRAAVSSNKHDWSAATLAAVLRLLGTLDSARPIKIEFQGGEPTLRPDLIQAVIDACERFTDRTFVICTNLSRLDAATLALFDRPDVFVSTSLNGDAATHAQQRTGTTGETDTFLANLAFVRERYGPGKMSALPTIDPAAPPPVEALIDAFTAQGLSAIFLRPINYQGFARKRHPEARQQSAAWQAYYEAFIAALIARNWTDRSRVLEETYFSLCLRRVLQPGHDRHVDLRNPNPIGRDYIVVNYNGQVYPTDEARMLSRAGVIDLAIGTIETGWDTEARAMLDAHSTNLGDPACDRCAYQPFCGRDLIDDLARYGRIDLPRHGTAFCQRHQHIFDLVFRLIYSDDPAVQYSLARWLRLPGDSVALGATLGTTLTSEPDAMRADTLTAAVAMAAR